MIFSMILFLFSLLVSPGYFQYESMNLDVVERLAKAAEKLNAPIELNPCSSNSDCQDANLISSDGQYCNVYIKKCSYKKPGYSFCADNSECASGDCHTFACAP